MVIGAIHLVRWALYSDLGILFGAPLFAIGLARPRAEPLSRTAIGFLAGAGLILSAAGFTLTAAGMTGTGVFEITADLVELVLASTSAGWAFLVRFGALALILVSSAIKAVGPTARATFAAALGAIAVGSLAWSGHAAASDGIPGLVRLAGDMVHMLAASVWMGALIILLRQLAAKPPQDEENALRSWLMLSRFGRVGTVIVAALALTGLLNVVFLFELSELPQLTSTPYGQLLLIKLLLFGAMLSLAALNRFRLTPALAHDVRTANPASISRALRLSIGLEFGLMSSILALVGWLGTLEPAIGS